ncbi:MAG: 3-oxoacyl-[acyl-carrier-protein] reductase [Rhodospirillaceae bacterium]
MFEINGKRALITGASGGIGSAVARCLHEHGVEVILSGRNEGALRAMVRELGDRAFYVKAALEEQNAAKTLVKEVEDLLGSVDILVNNAGLTRDSLTLRMSDEDWDEVIGVNLTASFKLSKEVLRGMMKSRWGRIINITSVVGFVGNPGQTNYVASKAGLSGMSKALAAEVASRGITVNCVAPGFIATPMTEALSQDQKSTLLQKIPVRRFGEPMDVAASVLFLASHEASYVTGETIHVNGGMAMI